MNVVLLLVAVVAAHTWVLIIDKPKLVDNRERAATTHQHTYFDFVRVRCVLPCAFVSTGVAWPLRASCLALRRLAPPCPHQQTRRKREEEERRNGEIGKDRKG